MRISLKYTMSAVWVGKILKLLSCRNQCILKGYGVLNMNVIIACTVNE